MHDQHIGNAHGQDNERKILHRVVGQCPVQRRVDRVRHGGHSERVPVGSRFRHHVFADGRACTRAIVDDDRNVPGLAELLSRRAVP